MTGRTFVLIFFFWAVLTIVTPTLILLSESSKPDYDFKVEKSRGLKEARKMMAITEKLSEAEATPAPVPTEAPTPCPAPAPVSGARSAVLPRFLEKQ